MLGALYYTHMKRISRAIIAVGILLAFTGSSRVFADTSLKLAPSRSEAQARQAPVVSSSNELDLLVDLEAKIIEKIPTSIKDSFNSFDARRVEQARKYEQLRDTAQAKNVVVSKKNATQTNNASKSSPRTAYYIYTVMAVFFGYKYIFYGAILTAVFLLLRVILRYFNVIV